jgi:uncharacterized protein DUF5946
VIETCLSCGLAVAGGMEGCQRLFESIGLREYEDMRFAAHLIGLCSWLEDEAGAQSVNAAVQRWLSGPSPIERPALPTSYGALTIRGLVEEVDPVRYGDVLRRWARSTWDAYAPLHAVTRVWMATALAR